MEGTGCSRRSFVLGGTAGLALGLSAGARVLGASQRVRIGFIGIGGRGSNHLRILLSMPDVEVVAVCDIDEGHLNRAADAVEKAFGTRPATCKDYRDLLDRKDVDAVVNATPPDIHARHYLDTIAAGKDLYGEKPMCIAVEDCDAVVQAAQNARSIVQIGFQSRYNPRVVDAMRRIHAGDVGDLVEVRGGYCASFGPLRGWQSKRARSGDWAVEQAVHFFDIMNWAFRATPKTAYGWGRRDIFTAGEPDRDVTDYYSALIEYPGGAIVNWLHTWLCPKGGVFDRHYQHYMGRRGGIDLNGGAVHYFGGKAAETLPEEGGDATRYAQQAFLRSVRTREKPASGVENGRDAVLVALLVRTAVDDRRLVRWDELHRTR
ncbi:MAG: Gfo/Idh/MocA family oxidoreductase [Planctomycetes bacterium]|nr:Gfo/Idh/MocA family oxidoreductase [Planctomycetota bacterium]